ncbi:hypothetical protein AB1K54_10445 [Microbacterium sp. BWT-B31]|uniref:hypothetical protein n=1 Tax=Microbacterium sp. BWT-B31 TaxID=3232072 RepID=UPI0035296CDB
MDDDSAKAEQKDLLLYGLVKGITELGGRWGLTVHVGGATVSGIAIGSREWFDGLLDLMDGAGEGGDVVAHSLAQSFMELGPDRLAALSEGFLHMRDASILAGGTTLTMPLWRGALSEVTGWSSGNI